MSSHSTAETMSWQTIVVVETSTVLLASFPGHFLRGRKKGPGIICSRMRARDSQEKLGIRIRMDIFRVLARSLPLHSRICTTDDG